MMLTAPQMSRELVWRMLQTKVCFFTRGFMHFFYSPSFKKALGHFNPHECPCSTLWVERHLPLNCHHQCNYHSPTCDHEALSCAFTASQNNPSLYVSRPGWHHCSHKETTSSNAFDFSEWRLSSNVRTWWEKGFRSSFALAHIWVRNSLGSLH